MYLLKYGLRNVLRAKGRSILIATIVMIIACAVCIALCIRQSAADAQENALEEITITAQISPDREGAMDRARENSDNGKFDPSQLQQEIVDSLTLDEMLVYANANSVQSFYYTMTVEANASGSLEPYSTSSSSDDDSSNSSSSSSNNNGPEGQGDMPGGQGMQSADFELVGYSSDEAMTDFIDGAKTITEGQMFEEGTDEKVCVVSDELAEYNDLEVGDKIKICSAEDEDVTYKFKIVGIYNNTQSSAQAMDGGPGGGMGMGGFVDPANYIYTSYTALANMVDSSDEFEGSVSGTYVLGTVEAYEAFKQEVEDLGLSDEYTVSSSDVSNYERSAQPLENLANFSGYFLLVVLGVGAIILIVINIFATRERKYEIGVLTAIGMKKGKVITLFLTEILIITLVGVIVGGSIGAVSSVPVTNALLSSQTESSQMQAQGRDDNFGREFQGGGGPGGISESRNDDPGAKSDSPADQSENSDGAIVPSDNGMPDGPGGYMLQISSSVDIKVLLELLGICIVLALVAGMVSVIAIVRYEPLEILSNRD